MKHTTSSTGLSVSADGTGVVAHAGSVAVRMLADRTGLTKELSKATKRRSFAPVQAEGRSPSGDRGDLPDGLKGAAMAASTSCRR